MSTPVIRLNRQELRDRIHAAWIGKNIGGTIGTPYEGKPQFNDVKGFVTEKGAALPNDDLDLQLVWLYAMEQIGPYSLTSRDLAEFWISYITPHWNEYGIGKANLKGGLLPPLSGEYRNPKWKTSNGAWIRSEVWACLAPGYPDIAAKYAFMDASVDHGVSEGSYAEIFTVTMESLAFYETDIRRIIELSLAKIPEESLFRRCIQRVLDEYDRGTDWRQVRDILVEMSRDIGWFQAPANVGFAVIGLLWGKGDFKQSVIYAVNCGDDTDCTSATVGAFLGILGGTKAIPADWSEYIGDAIITISLDRSKLEMAKSCSELTDRIMRLIPTVFLANGVAMDYTDGESFWGTPTNDAATVRRIFDRSPFSYDVDAPCYMKVRVEFDEEPTVRAGTTVRARLVMSNNVPVVTDPRHLDVRVLLPEGFTAGDYPRRVYMDHQIQSAVWEVEITANDHIQPLNRVVVEIAAVDRPGVCYAPVILLG